MIILDKLKLKFYSSYKINRLREKYLSLVSPNKDTKIIFIFGCQRSGTTIIQKIISLNPLIKYHGEGDEPYFFDENSDDAFRLKKEDEIKQYIHNECHEYIALKPLYESHRALELMSSHKGSKGLWIFRDYNEVINSHLGYYNINAIDYIRPVFKSAQSNWKNEYISDNVKTLLHELSVDELSDADAYALFWLLRNSIYLDIHSKHNDNILLINYTNLLEMPEQQTTMIFDFLGLQCRSFYHKLVRSSSKKTNYEFVINPIIKNECEKVMGVLRGYCKLTLKKGDKL